jgi:hypothetical protein
MASYVFARVCDEQHQTRSQALHAIIRLVEDERYYTRNERPPKIMRRTPMIGIGSHGGRGLFVVGHCAGLNWERLDERYRPYLHRIAVLWSGAIYEANYDEVFDGVSKYNERSWTSATQRDFALVHSRVLAGEVVVQVKADPALPWAS